VVGLVVITVVDPQVVLAVAEPQILAPLVEQVLLEKVLRVVLDRALSPKSLAEVVAQAEEVLAVLVVAMAAVEKVRI
jgi:hypothetical protein